MTQEITAALVMNLRKQTGVGMSKCKEALIESKGNVEEAVTILRKKGVVSAVKKGDRETKEGIISYAENDSFLSLVEVHVETDFVLQNEKFSSFLKSICHEALALKPVSTEEFLKQTCTQNPSLTIDEYRAEIVNLLGENVQIGRTLSFEKKSSQSVGIYSHMGGKIVTVVVIEGSGNQTSLAYEVALHVTAQSPSFISSGEVPEEVLSKEREIAFSQIQNKPKGIQEKIVNNKLNAYYEQNCLLNQKYVKDPSLTVEQLINKSKKAEENPLKIKSFVRWQVGA